MPTFKNPKQKRKGSKVLSETRTIEICLRTSMQDIGYTELCIAFFSSLLSSSWMEDLKKVEPQEVYNMQSIQHFTLIEGWRNKLCK